MTHSHRDRLVLELASAAELVLEWVLGLAWMSASAACLLAKAFAGAYCSRLDRTDPEWLVFQNFEK
jgi:hypothetical protein